VLAERTGLAYVQPPYLLDKEYKPLEWSDEPLFTLTPTEGQRLTGVPVTIKAKQWFDFSTVNGDRPIMVREGFFQRWELFAPYLDKIRNDWLHIEPRRFIPTDDNAVYAHVRLTDYVRLADGSLPDPRERGAASKPEEFSWCLREFRDCNRLYIVSDSPDDAETLGWDKIIYDAGCKMHWSVCEPSPWDEDFLLLASAKNLVISQSTYSWLAGLLGRSQKIVCPCPAGSFWRRGLASREQPDLFLPVDTDREWVWCLDENDRLRSVRVSTSQPAMPH
jgi:hypothetical protein